MIERLTARRLQTNPRLVVTSWDDLRSEDRDRLRELRADPGFFGIAAVPRAGDTIKAIDGYSAALLRDLRTPSYLPDHARGFLVRDGGEPLLRLLLDDLLQIEAGERFLGGAAVLELFPEVVEQDPMAGELGRLSDDALRYAASLRVRDAPRIAERLYSYNTAPADPRHTGRFTSPSRAAQALGLTRNGRLARAIADHWMGPLRFETLSWWTFTSPTAPDVDTLRFKVYLSPSTTAFARALETAIPILKRHRCPAFKIGAGLHQLLRPDKCVAYFANYDGMMQSAVELAEALTSLTPHGVPFTSSVDGSLTVSWGIDPPPDAAPLSWQAHDSWRTWVTRRLGRYLVIARHDSTTHIKPWQFARARLRLDGVDTARWTARGAWAEPTEVSWSAP